MSRWTALMAETGRYHSETNLGLQMKIDSKTGFNAESNKSLFIQTCVCYTVNEPKHTLSSQFSLGLFLASEPVLFVFNL